MAGGMPGGHAGETTAHLDAIEPYLHERQAARLPGHSDSHTAQKTQKLVVAANTGDHPERVSHLILIGAYVRGRRVRATCGRRPRG